MEFDFTYGIQPGNAIVFPDWCFVPPEKQAADIKETVILRASNTQVNTSIAGTADQPE